METALAIVANDDEHEDVRPGAGRAHKRISVMLAATIHSGGAEVKVVLRDISRQGAQISSPVIPAIGSYITLSRGEIAVTAQVVWAEGSTAGLRFREEIDEAALLASLRRPGTVAAH